MLLLSSYTQFITVLFLGLTSHFINAEIKASLKAEEILTDNCLNCHGKVGKKVKGGFNLSELLKSTDNQADWMEVYRQIDSGDMPPEDEKPLSKAEKETALNFIKIRASSNKETYQRVLSPVEIKNTLNDLLDIDEKFYNPFDSLTQAYSHEKFYTMQTDILTPYYINQLFHVYHDSMESFVFTRPQVSPINLRASLRKEGHKIFNGPGGKKELRYPRGDSYNYVIYSKYGKAENSNKEKALSSTAKSRQAELEKYSLPAGTYRFKFRAEALNLDMNKWTDKNTFTPTLLKFYQTVFERDNLNAGLPIDFYIAPPTTADAFAPSAIYAGTVLVKADEVRDYVFKFTLKRRAALQYKLAANLAPTYKLKKMLVKDKGLDKLKVAEREKIQNAILCAKDCKLPLIRFHKVAIEGPYKVPVSELSFNNKQEVDKKNITKKLGSLTEMLGLKTSDTYTKIYDSFIDKNFTKEDAYRNTVSLLLTSPEFLTISNKKGGVQDYIRYSSYSLHKSAPTKEFSKIFLEARDSGKSRTLANYLIEHKNFKRFTDAFVYQWLQLKEIEHAEPDQKFKIFHKNNFKDAYRIELELYFLNLFRENRPVKELVKSDYSFLNNELKAFYDGTKVDKSKNTKTIHEDDFQKHKLSSSTRGGILSMGAFLTSTGNGVDPLPLKRSLWINANLLDSPLPPPPEDIDLTTFEVEHSKTLKERLAIHGKDPSCTNCHKKIDPFAIIMDRYDTIGDINTKYSPDHVTVDNKKIKNINELKDYICSQEKRLATSFCRQLLHYILGRKLDFLEEEKLKKIITANEKSGYRCGDLYDSLIRNFFF